MRSFFSFLILIPTLASATVDDQSTPLDICAYHLSIGEVPTKAGPIVTTAPIFKTSKTRMPSETSFALLLGYWQRQTGDYALYYMPVWLPDLVRDKEPKLVENIRTVVIRQSEFGDEIAAWVEGSIGEVQITIEKNITDETLEQKIKYSKFRTSSQGR